MASMDVFSQSWHGLLQRASWLFQGAYGRAPDPSRVLPDEDMTLQAGAVSLRVLRWRGVGTPILMLHGLNSNAWVWARVASQLRVQHDVFAVSLRGHGGSSAPDSGYDLLSTTGDIAALMKSLGLDRVHLAGHSWGGKVACHVAAHHPDRVASLLLADPAPPGDLNRVIRSVPWLIEATFRVERGPFASHAQWQRARQAVGYLRIGDDIDRRLWEASFRSLPDGSVHHHLPDSAYREILERTLAQDIRADLCATSCPALLMLPTFSLSFLPGEVRTWRRCLHHPRVVRVPGDHTFIHTNSLDTAAVMRSFLDGQRPAP